MRQWIPRSLIAVMTVLALVSVVLSVQTSARISYFSTPPAGDQGIAAIFRTVVQRSLDAPGFTYNQFLHFRAPDRTAVIAPGAGIIVVGNETYVELAGNSSSQQQPRKWGETTLTPFVDNQFGPAAATRVLKMLLTAVSVTRAGDHFTAQEVVSANSVEPGNAGQILITYVIYVNDDYVTSVTPTYHGWFVIPSSGLTLSDNHVATYQNMTITYGNFGNVAPIAPPPALETVVLEPCSGPHSFSIGNKRLCAPAG
jgi:hypothetical protein